MHLCDKKESKVYGTGTVGEFIFYWLNNIVKYGVKNSTFSNHVHYSEKWIIPYLNQIKLKTLTAEKVQQFINHLTDNGLSAGSVRNVYRTLSAALKKAEIYGYLQHNPNTEIILPENKPKIAKTLSLDNQKKLENAAKQETNGLGLVILLALYAGLRIGEICALAWDDVDFEKMTLSVSKTRQRIQHPESVTEKTKTCVTTGRAKSNSSERIIPLPTFLLTCLQEQKNNSTSNYIFTYKDRLLEPRLLQYRFKKLLKVAEIEPINFHALRHTFATRCMEKCIDIKTISELLGHSSAKITLDLYGHSRFEQKQIAMNNLQQLFLDSR